MLIVLRSLLTYPKRHLYKATTPRTYSTKIQEDDKHIITGMKPLQPLPRIPLGAIIFNALTKLVVTSSGAEPALIDAATKRTITYNEVLCTSCRLSIALQHLGYAQNTKIAVCAENCLEYFLPILAAFYSNAIVTPINPFYTAQELIYTLNIAKPKVLFTTSIFAPKFQQLKDKLSFIERIIVMDDISTLESFVKEGKADGDITKFRPESVANVDEQMSFIMYSSGTTGLPKGVVLTHTNILVAFAQLSDTRILPKVENDICLGIVPFFHVYGLITTICALCIKQPIVFLKKFDPALFLDTIQTYKVSRLILAPPLILFLALHPLVDKFDLSSVQEVNCGAAPLTAEMEAALRKRIKIKFIRQGYGLSEATLMVLLTPYGKERAGSCGQVTTYMQCKIRDPATGRSLPAGAVGELCFKGPYVMKGYLGNEQATKDTFTTDGWLRTGDLGYYDKDQYFFIVDRLKELIKYKGYQVSPAELEQILSKYPKIQDCGVVGVPHEKDGERPMAFIVPRPKIQLSKDEVIKFVASQVSEQKQLSGGIVFVEEIPRNIAGKINRVQLKALMKEKGKDGLKKS